MNILDLKAKVESEVALETVLVRFFGYDQNGGRCPLCGERHCIRPIEYEKGVYGYECQSREIEGKIPSLLVHGISYASDYESAPSGDAEMAAITPGDYEDAVRYLASLYLGIGEG